jgi:hypothetical protein
MLSESPVAITDKYGDFKLPNTNNGKSFITDPFKITGGNNTITGQQITYWYANAGTVTMTPITNLLFYCKEGALDNLKITTSIGIDNNIDFADYNYYKILLLNSNNKTSCPYVDAIKANNLGNAINVFATIGSYFLYGINGTDIDTEYDAMIRSIANISTGETVAHDDDTMTHTHEEVLDNEFAQLFGTNLEDCTTVITDRIRNKITNNSLKNAINTTNHKTYAELFARALAQQMAIVMTSIMGSTDVNTTSDYEIIGYRVTPHVYKAIHEIKSNLEIQTVNKSILLSYFSEKIASVFKTVMDNHFNVTTNQQTLARRNLVKSWNNYYEAIDVNKETVISLRYDDVPVKNGVIKGPCGSDITCCQCKSMKH